MFTVITPLSKYSALFLWQLLWSWLIPLQKLYLLLFCVFMFFFMTLFGQLPIIKGIGGEVIGCPPLYDTKKKSIIWINNYLPFMKINIHSYTCFVYILPNTSLNIGTSQTRYFVWLKSTYRQSVFHYDLWRQYIITWIGINYNNL